MWTRSADVSAGIQVNRENNTVSLVLPALSLCRPQSQRGAKVYVTTWDYDGGYRALNPQPQGHAMGGEPAEPRVMDDSGVIVLP